MTGSGASARLFGVVVFLAAALSGVQAAAAQAPAGPVITSPVEGGVLQGQVPINGVTDLPDFASAELAFAYDPDPSGTWFMLATSNLPVTGGVITTWDTTAVSDADYILRLRVTLLDGSTQETLLKVKVRNYTAVPTDTLAVTLTPTVVVQVPTAMLIVSSPTVTALPAPAIATPTALPPNPAGITTSEIFSGFWRGALIVGLIVLVFGALMRLRR
jgi:hypothetical protein